MSVQLAPSPVFQGLGFGGLPLPGGKLFTYVAGTTTPQATYIDSTQTTPNTNPVILNANGQANVWLDASLTYKLKLTDFFGNQIWVVDNIVGALIPNAANISYTPPGTGAVTTTVQSKLRQSPVSVIDFGADPTGTSDSTTAIQNALNFGSGVMVTPGTYNFTSLSVPSGVSIHGTNKATCTLNCTSSTGPGISVSASTSAIVIGSLTITCSGTRTSGGTISLTNSHNVRLTDLVFAGNHFIAIDLEGGGFQFEYYIDHIDFAGGAVGTGINIGTAAQVQDTFIDHVEIFGCSAGISLNYCSGIYFNQVSVASCVNGIVAAPSSGKVVLDWFATNTLSDTCTNTCWNISPASGGLVAGLFFDTCWGSSCTNTGGPGGFLFGGTGTIEHVQITGSHAFNNKSYGWEIANGTYITLVNCSACANSQSGINNFSGLIIPNTTSHVQIIGGIYGGVEFVTNLQSVGISLGANTDYITIVGCELTGNNLGPISTASTGTHNIIGPNAGIDPSPTAVTVTASPMSYTNNTGSPVVLNITGGTVSLVTVNGGQAAASTNVAIVVPRRQTAGITYSSAPTINVTAIN